MKNIIMQHYTGNLSDLAKLSIKNIQKYAKTIGADYKFLEGNVFHSELTPPCQKVHMLDQKWDEYDFVVMVDTDIFAVKNLKENIFTDIDGVGLNTHHQRIIFSRCSKKFPDLTCAKYPYFGGAVWRLNRQQRQELRNQINYKEMRMFNGRFEDEGMMHRLMTLARVKYNAIPHRWCYCSYLPNPGSAALIHIRTKINNSMARNAPRRTKMENYEHLKSLGVLD